MKPTVLKKDGQRGVFWITLGSDSSGALIEQEWRDTGNRAPRKKTTRFPPGSWPSTIEEFVAERTKMHLASGYVISELPPEVPLKVLTFSAVLEPDAIAPLLSRVGLLWLCTDITGDPSTLPDQVGEFPVSYSAMGNPQLTADVTVDGAAPWSNVDLQRVATFFVTVDADAKVVDGDTVSSALKTIVAPGVRNGTWDSMLESILVQLGICNAPVKISASTSATPFSVFL